MLTPIGECLNFRSAMRTTVFLTGRRASFIALMTLAIVAPAAGALAQSAAEPPVLRVAVFDVPPFSMKDEDGGWEGLSIELWDVIARHNGWTYELREYEALEPLMKAVESGEVDVTPAVASTLDLEVAMDLSHSYYQSGSGIAVPASGTGSGFGWIGILDLLISWEFVRLIGLLLLGWLTAGAIVWLFERRRNRAMFGDGPVDGVANGVWWAAVTMTTVGYGDKAPRTLGGRAVAIIWMLTSIVVISSLTAAITTSFTLEGLSGNVRGLRDLPGVRVGATAGSVALRFLSGRGIAVMPFANEREGLSAVADDRLDAFVFDALVLRYVAKTDFPGRVRVLPSTFQRYHVKMAIPPGSSLREPLNRALLKTIGDDDWNRRVESYLGSEH
jgi:ABC-type amino acid transport substrate-binding protein